MVGFLTYLKIGAVALVLAVGGYFYWNYNHMQAKIVTLEAEIEEQHQSIEWYEKATGTDKGTSNVRQKIQEAKNNNDVARVRELYKRLRDHQRNTIEGEAGAKTDNDPDRE